jgi:hypothetical protein
MSRTRWIAITATVALIAIGGLAFEIVATGPVRGALRTCAELFTIANRPGLDEAHRLEAARSLCSARYLRTHNLALATEGGIVGIPRNLHKNFKAWREGPNVWICPTNVGSTRPVYQFVFEEGAWQFDGPVGLLHQSGEVVPMADLPDLE